jgi:segregation and condensation protein A
LVNSTSTIGAPDSPVGIGGESFVVELERFQGPLDLLLHLIRSQDIDVFDIPIAHITAQFRAAIEHGLDEMPLERAGEFIEMSATLIRIKAQLLLPRPEKLEWEEDPRAELVRRLLEYEHFQDVVHVLQTAEAQRGRHMGKGFVETPASSRRVQVGSATDPG